MKRLLLVALPGVLAAQENAAAARIRSFDVQPRLVKAGESVVLTWTTVGADRVRLDPPGEEYPAQGQVTRSVEVPTVFWLSAVNGKGGQSIPMLVEVLTAIQPNRVPPTEVPAPWIQLAALADPMGAQRLQTLLGQRLGETAHILPVSSPLRAEQTLHRVRLGPFPSRAMAQQRLREILPKLRGLRLKPLIMVD